MVEKGVRKILTNGAFKPKTHRDLWKKIMLAFTSKGVHNFKVQKVKAHQTKQKPVANPTKEQKRKASARRLNEGADELVVEGAESHTDIKQVQKLSEQAKQRKQIGLSIQQYLLDVVKH